MTRYFDVVVQVAFVSETQHLLRLDYVLKQVPAIQLILDLQGFSLVHRQPWLRLRMLRNGGVRLIYSADVSNYNGVSIVSKLRLFTDLHRSI